MSDNSNETEVENVTDNGGSDAVAAVAMITITILAIIHFVYTGGLPAWISHILS